MQPEPRAETVGCDHGVHPASLRAEAPAKKAIPGTADFLPVACAEVLVVFLFDVISAVCQYPDNCGSHLLGRRGQGHVNDVRLMRDGLTGTGGSRQDSNGSEAAKRT